MGNIERKWVPVPRSTTIVLGDKMYWSEPDQQFIVLVKGHRFVKSIVRQVAEPPSASALIQDDFSTFMPLTPGHQVALETEASAAYEAGFDRFEGWQMLFKSKAAPLRADARSFALSD